MIEINSTKIEEKKDEIDPEKKKKTERFIKQLKMMAKDISERYKTPFFSLQMHKYALFAFWYNKKLIPETGKWWWECWLENFLKVDLEGKKVLLEQLMHKNMRLPERVLPKALIKQKWIFQQRIEQLYAIVNLLHYDPSPKKFQNLTIENFANQEIFDNFNEIITKVKQLRSWREAKRHDSLKGYLRKGGEKKK